MLLKARDEGVAVAEEDALGRGAPYKDDEEAMYRRGGDENQEKSNMDTVGQYRWKDVDVDVEVSGVFNRKG